MLWLHLLGLLKHYIGYHFISSINNYVTAWKTLWICCSRVCRHNYVYEYGLYELLFPVGKWLLHFNLHKTLIPLCHVNVKVIECIIMSLLIIVLHMPIELMIVLPLHIEVCTGAWHWLSPHIVQEQQQLANSWVTVGQCMDEQLQYRNYYHQVLDLASYYKNSETSKLYTANFIQFS